MKLVKTVGNKTLEVGWGWGPNDVQEGWGAPIFLPVPGALLMEFKRRRDTASHLNPDIRMEIIQAFIKEQGIKQYLEKLR